ncbi:hypothetical protein NJ7G_1961 [Natrinema sp. J7-2]|nr:hypothetical protein NJ7G_1961 [Natrinema sp. J7-2]
MSLGRINFGIAAVDRCWVDDGVRTPVSLLEFAYGVADRNPSRLESFAGCR